MKKLILFTFIFLNCSLLAEEAGIDTPVEPEVQGRIHNVEGDKLQQVLAIPEVNGFYEECKTEIEQNPSQGPIDECLWNKVNAPGNEKLVKQVESSLAKTKTEEEVDKKYDSLQLIEIETQKSPALQELQKHFQAQLEKALYDPQGSGKDRKHNYVNHKVFNNLFRSQLGKNIILAITSYCIEADADHIVSENESDRIQNKTDNLTSLNTSTKGQGKNDAYETWRSCIRYIDPVCHDGSDLYERDANGKKIPKPAPQQGFKIKASINDYSQRRACEVVQYLKAARLNLKALDKIDEGYNELDKRGNGLRMVTDIKHYEGKKEGASIDELTTISSNELKSDLKYGDAKKAELAELEKCIVGNKDQNGTVTDYEITDAKTCEKYLLKDQEEIRKLQAEVKLRAEAFNNKIKALAENKDAKEIEEYLIDQGYSEDEIESKFDLSDQAVLDSITNDIKNRVEREKEALIGSLREKIDGMTTEKAGDLKTTPGAFTIDDTSITEDSDRLIKIHKELSSDTENYTKLIHFTNIVSSYLEVGEGDDKTQNTASFYAEMENSAFDPENDNTSAYVADQSKFETIETNTNIGSDSRSPSSDDDTVKTVGREEINELLDYEAEAVTPNNP
jgi:hypothetical protein